MFITKNYYKMELSSDKTNSLPIYINTDLKTNLKFSNENKVNKNYSALIDKSTLTNKRWNFAQKITGIQV